MKPQVCYAAIMILDLEGMPETKLRSELEKYMRLFDVAHGTLLRLSHTKLDADAMHKDAADALKTIDSYPNHPRFTARLQQDQ
jgi:hypothetical protein